MGTRRNELCPCGSGKRFKKCCALSGPDNHGPATRDPEQENSRIGRDVGHGAGHSGHLSAQEHYDNALQSVRQGQPEEAIKSFKAALSLKPAAEVYCNLGLIQERSGNLAEAIDSYKSALALKPDLTPANLYLGKALWLKKEFPEAQACFEKVLLSDPENYEALFSLALVHEKMAAFPEARACFQKVLVINPESSPACNNLGAVQVKLGNFAEAKSLFQKALALNPDFTQAHFNLGAELIREKNFSGAATCFERALAIDPSYADAYFKLAIVYDRRGLFPDAEAFIVKYLNLIPADSMAYNFLGAMQTKLENFAGAEDSFQMALSLDPDNFTANYNLADVYEKRNIIEKAEQHLAKSLASDGNNPNYLLLAAKLAYRQKDFSGALEKLLQVERSADDHLEAMAGACSLLGKIYDQTGEEEKAFNYFLKMNEAAVKVSESINVYPETYRAEVEHLRSYFTKDRVSSWPEISVADSREVSPVFMVGFPRSGTTLLDQILATHKDVEVVEERPMISMLVEKIAGLRDGFPGSLASLANNDVLELRHEYHEIIRQYLPDGFENKLIVDKSPLNLVQMGTINRLFPDAKIIMVMRHPYDVCLSNFMQYFTFNTAMANFNTLASTAGLYAEVMALWQQYRQVLDVNCHIIRYEDLVADFETEIRGLLAFLSLPWDQRMVDYHQYVDQRRSIKTPSYQDISSPVFSRARYRWKRYEKYLAGVREVLAPYVDDFGYGPN